MAARSWGLACASLAQRWSLRSSSSRSVLASQWSLTRSCSSQSGEGAGASASAASADAEGETNTKGQIEQALREIRIWGSAPDWLPLFPGGSFWIHPDQIAKVKPQKPSGPLLDPVTDMEILAMVMPMGWPSPKAADDALSPQSSS